MEYTQAPIDILNMSIKEIQENVDLGIINYETIARIYLERIEAYDKNFNAMISVNENIVKQAKLLDEKYKESGRTSMLYGIPIVLKDNIDYKEMATTAGAKGLADNIPYENATLVQKLVDAGALIIGKANMSEFAFSAAISKSSYGTVKNAYDTSLTSYGSSGGTAVAVSTGMAVAGIGTDTNSSIRVPSSAANLVGLRPTYGNVSSSGMINYDASRDTAGPMTKYTSDNAIILDIITENDTNYAEYETSVKGMKIGVLSQFVNGSSSMSYVPALKSTSKVVKNLFNETIERLEEQGAEIVYIEDLYNNTTYNYYLNTIGGWTMCYFFNKYIKNTNSSVKSFVSLVNKGGYIQPLADYASCCNDSISTFNTYEKTHEKYESYIEDKMEEYGVDVLTYPTTKNEITKIKSASVISPSFTISPVTGMPAISISMGFSENKLPYGIEVVTKKNNENLLYTISNALVKEGEFEMTSLTPNLYEIDDDVDKLVELYKSNYEKLNTDNYENVKEDIQEFFKSYNAVEDKEQTAISLINAYDNVALEVAAKAQKEKMARGITIAAVIGVIILILIVRSIIKKTTRKKSKKKKNIKKNRNRRNTNFSTK